MLKISHELNSQINFLEGFLDLFLLNEYLLSGRVVFLFILLIIVFFSFVLVRRHTLILTAFGSVSSRWALRFQCRDYAGIQNELQGSYFTLDGHTKNCLAVLTGRLHSIAVNIINFNYESGSGLLRRTLNKTLIAADLDTACSNIVVLYSREIVPNGRYDSFILIDPRFPCKYGRVINIGEILYFKV